MSEDQKKGPEKEPFGFIMKSMNDFFQEKPVKGFMQSVDDLFHQPFLQSSFQLNLDENETSYIVSANLAGVKKEHIEIETYPRYMTLTITNQEERSVNTPSSGFMFSSKANTKTTKSIPFPQQVDDTNVDAQYKDGLLVVTVPKLKGKKIQIR
ncbi:Hsp20/alpha crystallin family protein [Mangrovibacillus cuniculi]|uniref:Hsp20/alpha crystallin family protein n=1 Tax=Mangrovibacillus cuniculi TaxID=2593652 RepID=A0A7S8CB05_9BACI|nr:Hsp20/alpha crystallin family protein [Mangrovibacillus cuniculi]QPC46659.1 Hsp20/alpha crystallin family protein [Mangrovibacillus cuniculi]